MTPRQIITEALGIIGARAPGETIGPNELDDCFAAFVRMLDALAIEKLVQRWEGATTFGTEAGQQEYVISPEAGQASAFDVFSIGMADANRQWMLERAQRDDLLAISPRGIEGIPSSYTISGDQGSIKLTLWPVPDDVYTVIANLSAGCIFSTVDQIKELSPGVYSMLVYNLAIELCPMYEREPTSVVVMKAKSSKSHVKRLNWQGITVDNEMVGMVR